MARANVPKFDNWEIEESVPYADYFKNARKTMEGRNAMETKEGNMTDRDSYHSFLAPGSDGAPGRSQRRPFHGDGSHDKVAYVPRFGEWNESAPQSAPRFGEWNESAPQSAPRFGEWNESTPQSADDYIFNKVRPVRADASPEKGVAIPRFGEWDEYDERSNEPKKCCFPWW